MAMLLGRLSNCGLFTRTLQNGVPALSSSVLPIPQRDFRHGEAQPSLLCLCRSSSKQATIYGTTYERGKLYGTQNLNLYKSRKIHQQQSNTDFEKETPVAILSPRWIVETSPEIVKPYLRLMRFDRPIGTWLVYLPCTWGIALATAPGHLPDPKMLALFALGSFFMRGAGCTINDMWDKRYDAMVERTRDRPLASGQLSNFQALVFLGVQLSCSLAVLLTLNMYSIVLGACCMIPVIVYPLMKRFMHWPHVFLGVTLNWGIMVSWSAVQGSCDWSIVFPLYLSGVMFTTIYDLIYAHQDKEDDVIAGVKSAALKLGERTKPWLTGFASVMVSSLGVSGYMCEQTWPYFTGVGVVAGHLAYQIYTVDLNCREDCARKFRSNKALGFFLFVAIMTGTYIKHTQDNIENSSEQSDDE